MNTEKWTGWLKKKGMVDNFLTQRSRMLGFSHSCKTFRCSTIYCTFCNQFLKKGHWKRNLAICAQGYKCITKSDPQLLNFSKIMLHGLLYTGSLLAVKTYDCLVVWQMSTYHSQKHQLPPVRIGVSSPIVVPWIVPRWLSASTLLLPSSLTKAKVVKALVKRHI